MDDDELIGQEEESDRDPDEWAQEADPGDLDADSENDPGTVTKLTGKTEEPRTESPSTSPNDSRQTIEPGDIRLVHNGVRSVDPDMGARGRHSTQLEESNSSPTPVTNYINTIEGVHELLKQMRNHSSARIIQAESCECTETSLPPRTYSSNGLSSSSQIISPEDQEHRDDMQNTSEDSATAEQNEQLAVVGSELGSQRNPEPTLIEGERPSAEIQESSVVEIGRAHV
jgi:hypothetical protein